MIDSRSKIGGIKPSFLMNNNNNNKVDIYCWIIGFLTVIIALAIFRSTPPDPYKLDKYVGYCLVILFWMLTTRTTLKETKKLSFKKVFKASSAALLSNGLFYLVLYFIISIFYINAFLLLIPPSVYFGYQLLEKNK